MPFRLEGGLLTVEVALPGDRRGRFLFDTGAGNFTLCDPSLTKEIGLVHGT